MRLGRWLRPAGAAVVGVAVGAGVALALQGPPDPPGSHPAPAATVTLRPTGTAAPSGADEHRRCYANFTCDPSDVWTGLWRESPSSTAGAT